MSYFLVKSLSLWSTCDKMAAFGKLLLNIGYISEFKVIRKPHKINSDVELELKFLYLSLSIDVIRDVETSSYDAQTTA